MTNQEKPPLKVYLLLIPGFLVGSYLFYDIPYFLHDTFGYGYCDTGGPCTRLFDNVPWMMFPLALMAMFSYWTLFFGMLWAFHTGRWDPTK